MLKLINSKTISIDQYFIVLMLDYEEEHKNTNLTKILWASVSNNLGSVDIP